MQNGFIRVASASPRVSVADVAANVSEIKVLMAEAAEKGADLTVFPEMSLTAYTCADLFHSRELLDSARRGLDALAAESAKYPGAAFVVGVPVEAFGALYNCAAVLAGGRLCGIVPKTYVPGYNEFYERRWFESGEGEGGEVLGVPFGTDLLFRLGDATFGVEICEDLWVPVPPSCRLALAGAEVIVNLSASDDLIGKYDYLMSLISQQSARCLCGYAYASAGFGESSTDLVFDAKLVVAENGHILERNGRWVHGNQIVAADVDLEAIRRDRLHLTSFAACRRNEGATCRVVDLGIKPEERGGLLRDVDPRPFVPSSGAHLRDRCEEIVNIQAEGLAKRLDATHTRTLVVGISGGLDSTLALLVAVRSFDKLGLDRKGIVGVTMPGFGTTGRTHGNALKLMEALGVTSREISIVKAVEQHFSDIGQDPTLTDVTYENSQARERTQILMDLANKLGGMVLGTGDLSELALGWATYNGDHMSMYGVNSGVPKTLVRHLVSFFADIETSPEVSATLRDIVDTPISPELTPAAADGSIAQKTEDLVGPYELHDFFLYYTLRYGFTPRRIFYLAQHAFRGAYSDATIAKWLRTFFRRFFNQQFKRSCLPDGPKTGSVCLSPRGDWRMPSDASSAQWLKECDGLIRQYVDANQTVAK